MVVGGPVGRPDDHCREGGGCSGDGGEGPKMMMMSCVGVFRTAHPSPQPHHHPAPPGSPVFDRVVFFSFSSPSSFIFAILSQTPKSKSRFINPRPSPLVLHLSRHAPARTG